MKINDLLINMKILYVEDDTITQTIIKELIKPRVGKLYVASDGQEALQKFEQYQPDIIITDLRMPKLDGFGLIQAIRDSGSECGIVVSTEVNDVNEILKSTNLGIDKYIVKPMSEQAVENCLSILAFRMMNRGWAIRKQNRINPQEKEFKEARVKAVMQRFTKKVVGKGPRDIQVFINGPRIEIKNYDVLTPIELKTVGLDKSNQLVEFMRITLYKGYADEVMQEIMAIVNMPIKFSSYAIDIEKSIETFVFNIGYPQKKVL